MGSIAQNLIVEKKTEKFIVVGIWNNDLKRSAEYFPQKPFESLDLKERETITLGLKKLNTGDDFKPISDLYLTFLVYELKPFIDKSFSSLNDKSNTIIAGSSMGGLISIYGICQYPDVFGGAACLSTHWPGIFKIENNPVPDAFFNYLKSNLPDPETHKIYYDCGDQTLDALYIELQRKVDFIMKDKGYKMPNWVTKYFPGEDHSEIAWSKRIHIPLIFLLGKTI